MNTFIVLHIQEHVYADIKRIDNRLCILFDASENTFFYYGTRNNRRQTTYADFNGHYKHYHKDYLLNFMKFLLGRYEEVITTELHYLNIPESEYSELNYNNLLDKMSDRTILSAYDKKTECEESISEYINFLIQN